MKGQSLVIQFLLFFVIGLGIFASIGGFFRLQSDVFREDVANSTRKLINSYISSVIILENTCKECGFINTSIKLRNTTANYFYELYLGDPGLTIVSQPGGKIYTTTVHRLNETLKFLGFGVSSHPIFLTKDQNIIEMKCDIVYASDRTVCEIADRDGLCDGLDLVFGDGYRCNCCNEHILCCPC